MGALIRCRPLSSGALQLLVLTYLLTNPYPLLDQELIPVVTMASVGALSRRLPRQQNGVIVQYPATLQRELEDITLGELSEHCLSICSISFMFGGVTCGAGIIGVWLGAEAARRYRRRNASADALVCAIGLLSCTPFLYGALVLASTHTKMAYVSMP